MSDIEDLIRTWKGEEVVVRFESELNTWIFVSIHSTRLGPAAGGTRIVTYPTPPDALADGMKLAEAMTQKMAVVGLPFGGGKAVLAVPVLPQGDDRRRLLEVYAAVVNSLNGTFHTATDMNSTEEDMNFLFGLTPYAHGKSPSLGGAGSSGPPTAVGVYHGIMASLGHAFGTSSVEGRSILIQGVGGVGGHLAELLHRDGARLLLSDIAEDRVRELAGRVDGTEVDPGSALETPCDVFAPCAMGGVISTDVVDRLACRVVAGSANNQLADPGAGDALRTRGILYAPDFVINAGGAIHLTALEMLSWDRDRYERQMAGIGDTLSSIYRRAEDEGLTTEQAALRLVEDRLAAAG